MDIANVNEKWPGTINTLTIGATAEDGGTRGKTVTIGGQSTLPGLSFEGENPHRPVIAGMVTDMVPEGWPGMLVDSIGQAIDSPGQWAAKLVESGNVDLICLKLCGTDPLTGDRSPQEAADTVKEVLQAVDVPLIIWGSGNEEKDNLVLQACSEAARGENCLLGAATDSNYRTLAAIGKADKHKLVSEAPCDINIGKQVNILLEDAGFDLKEVVMCQVTAALGYGFDYVYTILERVRLAGLKGDRQMALPQIANVGWEVWKVKEAVADEADVPGWGEIEDRGPKWEIVSAAGYLQSGADIITLSHPDSMAVIKKMIDDLQ